MCQAPTSESRTVHQYHRLQSGPLQPRGVVAGDEWLTSALLEGFAVLVSELWPGYPPRSP